MCKANFQPAIGVVVSLYVKYMYEEKKSHTIKEREKLSMCYNDRISIFCSPSSHSNPFCDLAVCFKYFSLIHNMHT